MVVNVLIKSEVGFRILDRFLNIEQEPVRALSNIFLRIRTNLAFMLTGSRLRLQIVRKTSHNEAHRFPECCSHSPNPGTHTFCLVLKHMEFVFPLRS